MKQVLNKCNFSVFVMALIFLTGCQQAEKVSKQEASQSTTPAVVSAMTGITQALETQDTQAAEANTNTLVEQASASKRKHFAMLPTKTDQYTVLFDINSNQLNAVYQGELITFAEYLHKHLDAKIHVNGFTCELGSSEYNVALGQRRAQSVAQFLENKGVRKEQIIIVSYGKERPADPLHNELAWMKNRRVEVFF